MRRPRTRSIAASDMDFVAKSSCSVSLKLSFNFARFPRTKVDDVINQQVLRAINKKDSLHA